MIDKDPLMDEFRHDTFRLKMYSLVGRESQYNCEGYINVKTAVEMAGSTEDNAEERVTHDGSESHNHPIARTGRALAEKYYIPLQAARRL